MPACSAELRQAPQLFRVAVHWWPWETGRTLSKTSKILEAMITRKLNSYAAEAGGDSVIGDRGLLAWEMWIWRHPGRENLLAGPSHSNRRPTWVCILLNPVNNIKNKMKKKIFLMLPTDVDVCCLFWNPSAVHDLKWLYVSWDLFQHTTPLPRLHKAIKTLNAIAWTFAFCCHLYNH